LEVAPAGVGRAPPGTGRKPGQVLAGRGLISAGDAVPTDPRDAVTAQLVPALPMLRAWLRHLGADRDQIEEAVQDTAVWCCAHAQEFEPGSSFGAWTRAVARYRLLAMWRDRGRADHRLDDDLVEAIPQAEWDAAMDGVDGRREALARCLEGIPATARRLVELTYRDGCDAATVARRLASSVNAIYLALSKLRRRLRTCVERRMGAT
jgi:RNA polymerase sigma-70 factor (ECF subfamily)